jgi:tetratricopeptide (TPR) repeat protein
MRKTVIFFGFTIWIGIANAQVQDASQLHETGKSFMKQGDYGNAGLVLTKALQQEPENLEIAKDLALDYFFQKDNARALETIKPLLDRKDGDDQCFQIAGYIYKAMTDTKECEKMYKKGIKKFPQSGPIYNDYGELLWASKDVAAIKQWERGIEADPGYGGNYYNAAKYYYLTTDKIWGIIYGEVFINIEPTTGRTVEVKNILLDSYKKLFSGDDLLKDIKSKNDFEKAYLQTISNQSSIASYGISPETAVMIRTRFILDWYEKYASKFPSKLFEYHRQLLQEGMFDAYNQWIFGPLQNLAAYQNWTSTHAGEYTDFNKFQKGRIFKISNGQYYHK